MKKLAAIFLLVIFLFNLVGYRGWFYMAERQCETQLQTELDNELYNEADLITIRAPLQLPYVTDTREFQRVDGEVTMNGKSYRYVKSKIENGEYVMLCLPDFKKEQLEKAKDNFYKDANDLVQNGTTKKSGKSKSGGFKNILPEYSTNNICFNQLMRNSRSADYNIQPVKALLSAPHFSPFQPPDLS